MQQKNNIFSSCVCFMGIALFAALNYRLVLFALALALLSLMVQCMWKVAFLLMQDVNREYESLVKEDEMEEKEVEESWDLNLSRCPKNINICSKKRTNHRKENKMNLVIMIGRLTREPEINSFTTARGESSSAKFTIAVDDPFKKKEDGGKVSYFLHCVTYGATAGFVEKYIHKGSKVAIQGKLEANSGKNKEGVSMTFYQIVCSSVEFAGSKTEGAGAAENPPAAESFMDVPEVFDDKELPFH